MKRIFTTLILIGSFGLLAAQTKISALKDGDIYKFAVKETGVYRLDYAFLKNDLKIANLDQIDPRTIKVYGNGGGRLPEPNAEKRADDLTENAVLIEGESDGKFDAADAVLFYAIGADKTYFNAANHTFSRPKNIYSDQTYYYVKISTGNGLRVATQPSVANTTYTTTSYNDYARYEEDKLNILASASCNCTQGGGKEWFGDFLGTGVLEKNYSDKFNFPNLTSDSIIVRGRFAGASFSTAPFTITLGNQVVTADIYAIAGTGPDDRQGQAGAISERIASPFRPTDIFSLKVGYTGTKGWLDYVELNVRQNLKFNGTPLSFRDVRSLSKTSTNFQIANINANALIWDVSKAQSPKNQTFTNSSNTANFGAYTEGSLREFVLFDKTGVLLKPSAAVGKIANQNLHGIETTELLIVYPKEFEVAAKKLAAHRLKSGLIVETAEISQVYNEFSSGALDPAAIRDFAKLLHRRSPKFRYLLLLGDGSFDYKRIYPLGNLQPTDFIPAYETDDSFDAINAYPSDDFFGLLDDTEGSGLRGDLDISIGRIPCKTATEATGVVDKIIRYDSPSSLGDWRNRTVFMGDDGDSNLHMSDADGIADGVARRVRNLNLDKLYVDAYKLDVSSGGTRVPQLNEALFQNQFKGMLTLCYLGHGGPKGLAQERILMREDLESWRNIDKLPLLITATCSFTGFDNPKEVSAGEAAILNPSGGAIASFSTVRAVYASSNQRLTSFIFDTLFSKINRRAQPIGDIFRGAKNLSNTFDNGQKFGLFGDPSMRLAIPRFEVATTSINGKSASSAANDTVRALQKVTIEGTILDDNGAIMSDFNGVINPTVYDKVLTIKTLGQTSDSYAQDFRIQRNVLFKGAATVKNGRWSFSFVIPKDIDYAFGAGKISYYASDLVSRDAAGSFENFIIGGSSPSLTDNQPPKVEVFMNNFDWKSGGTTSANPTMLIKLSDDNGINVSGTSIGHDLTAVLNDSKTAIVLNNFYEATKDDPTKGTVKYPLNNLAEGTYTLKVKAWDVANNAGEGSTEFVVATTAKGALDKVLAYPNPFSTKTNFQFEHNLTGTGFTAQIDIFNVAGQFIQTISQPVSPNGNLVNGIEWTPNGGLASGLYVFKVTLSARDAKGKNQTADSRYERLVLIK
jgi:Peptidase family C25